MKKILSILLALLLVASVAAIAFAESTEESETTEEETVTTEEEADVAEDPEYTLEEMLTEAMTDAYTRQAAYAAYGETYSQSRSINAIDMDTQIVLLEMLCKANDVALPTVDDEVTVPETKAEAYAAIAEAESAAVTMYKTYLAQEDLAADAEIIFQSVYSLVRSNYSTFAQKAAAAERTAAIEALQESDNTQVYVINNGRNGTKQVVYVVTKDEETTTEEETVTEEETTEEVTDTTTEDGVSD